jgi:hypothetical protein
MKLRKGDYVIAIEGGEVDLYDLVNNLQELEYLTKIKESLLDDGLYPLNKDYELCINSLAALIIYIDELSILMDTSDSKDDSIH